MRKARSVAGREHAHEVGERRRQIDAGRHSEPRAELVALRQLDSQLVCHRLGHLSAEERGRLEGRQPLAGRRAEERFPSGEFGHDRGLEVVPDLAPMGRRFRAARGSTARPGRFRAAGSIAPAGRTGTGRTTSPPSRSGRAARGALSGDGVTRAIAASLRAASSCLAAFFPFRVQPSVRGRAVPGNGQRRRVFGVERVHDEDVRGPGRLFQAVGAPVPPAPRRPGPRGSAPALVVGSRTRYGHSG